MKKIFSLSFFFIFSLFFLHGISLQIVHAEEGVWQCGVSAFETPFCDPRPDTCQVGEKWVCEIESNGPNECFCVSKGSDTSQPPPLTPPAPRPYIQICPTSSDSLNLSLGGIQPLQLRYWKKLTGKPTCGTKGYSVVTQKATWRSSKESVATVTDVGTKGIVFGKAKGEATITVLYARMAASLTVNVVKDYLLLCPSTIDVPVSGVKSIEARYWSNLSDRQSAPTCETRPYKDVSGEAVWSVENDAVARIMNKGGVRVFGVSEGSTKIRASFERKLSNTVTVNVTGSSSLDQRGFESSASDFDQSGFESSASDFDQSGFESSALEASATGEWCVEGKFQCCDPNDTKNCITDTAICGENRITCETEFAKLTNEAIGKGYTLCTPALDSLSCKEKGQSPKSECGQKGGTCNASGSCGAGFTEELYDCDNGGDACCVPEENECTRAGGQCVPGASCLDGKNPLPQTCSGSVTQTCCPKDPGGGTPPPGGSGGAGGAIIEFPNPLKYDTVQEVVTAILGALQGIIVLLSVVFIVIGAVLYVTSAGNEGMVKLAKGAILASMIGLAIGIAAPTFLKEIYTILDATTEIPDEVANATPIREILLNTLNFLLAIIGTLSMIMLVVGGIMYLFSGGNQTRIDTGKKIVIFSIVGLSVALGAIIIVRQIANFFG